MWLATLKWFAKTSLPRGIACASGSSIRRIFGGYSHIDNRVVGNVLIGSDEGNTFTILETNPLSLIKTVKVLHGSDD
jgi:hypothetical protein